MKKVFYYTFDGITDHLGQSQVLPYIFGCSDKNKYHLFSHEKNLKQAKQDTELQKQLAEHSVSWSAAQFMYGKSIKKLLVTSLGILRMYKIIFTSLCFNFFLIFSIAVLVVLVKITKLTFLKEPLVIRSSM